MLSYYFVLFVHYGIFLYTVLIAGRIIGGWFPRIAYQPWMLFLARLTDPYLNLFRRLVPPIGGRFDLSPMLAFLGLNLVEKILLLFAR
jgi:YggT family protein